MVTSTTRRSLFALFAQWFDAARTSEINDPDSMALATVDADGRPDVRMVLCKGAEAGGLVFYTNVESAKGRQIEAKPQAAALFHWKSLRRQARFRGSVAPARRGDGRRLFPFPSARFANRRLGEPTVAPARSRARRWKPASPTMRRASARAKIPRPAYWRGFRLDAEEAELWADGAFRLHDRIRFTRTGEGWTRRRLYP